MFVDWRDYSFLNQTLVFKKTKQNKKTKASVNHVDDTHYSQSKISYASSSEQEIHTSNVISLT